MASAQLMGIPMMDVIKDLGGASFQDSASDGLGQRLIFGPIVAEAVTSVGRYFR